MEAAFDAAPVNSSFSQPCPGLRFAQDLQHATLHAQRIPRNGAGAAIGLVIGGIGDLTRVAVSLSRKLADLFSGMLAGLQRYAESTAAGADHGGFAAGRLPVAFDRLGGKGNIAAHQQGSCNRHHKLHEIPPEIRAGFSQAGTAKDAMRRSNSLQHASTISGRRPPCGATIAPPTAIPCPFHPRDRQGG